MSVDDRPLAPETTLQIPPMSRSKSNHHYFPCCHGLDNAGSMASLPIRSSGQRANPSSPPRPHRVSGGVKISPPQLLDRHTVFLDGAKRRSLSRSVTDFFNSLRPSRRAERGGTARPTVDDDAEHQRERPRPLVSTGSCREQRSRSLDTENPDTIPARLWNTPTTLPRRIHSTGSKARKPIAKQPPTNKPIVTLDSPVKVPLNSGLNEGCISQYPPTTPITITTPISTHRPPSPQPASSHALFLAKRELRRQRRTLISSGDFLGVTGANPYTGEPDIVTPPTSTSSALTTTTSATNTATTSLSSFPQPTEIGTTRKTQPDEAAAAEAVRRRRRKREKALRRTAKDEERLRRGEQRKDAVREAVRRRGVRWRREEGGWSSVAEPRLSPILQSPLGSGGKASPRGEGNGGSFLGVAAVVLGREDCRRRGWDVGEGRLRFSLSSPGPRRDGSLQEGEVDGLLECYPEWEVGNLVAIPVGIRRVSGECKVRRVTTGRVLELRDLDPAESGENMLRSLVSPVSMSPVEATLQGLARRTRGLGQALPSAYIRTTTTTGSEHSQARYRLDVHPSGGTLDGSHETPQAQTRQASMPRALSQPTSPLSTRRTYDNVSSHQLGSPSNMLLNVWQKPGNQAPETEARTTPSQETRGSLQADGPTRRLPLSTEPRAGSATTSSSPTNHETTSPAPIPA